jgi:hypothetical protein
MIKQVKSYANHRRAKTIRINEDVRAPYLSFGRQHLTSFGGKINTMILYKYLDSKHKADTMFSENNFFDPRDL